jgi:hypothetical protein
VKAVYLPPSTTAETYDEETNPTSVELEIFTPYGISYTDSSNPTPILNYIGFAKGSNMITQGLNLYGMAKVIDLDEDDSTVTMGLTLVLQSMYFAGYKVHSRGKIEVPKGCIISQENSDCRRFVAGELLNLEIKPLDLGAPLYEERTKIDHSEKRACGSCRNNGRTDENSGGSGSTGALVDDSTETADAGEDKHN